MTSGRLIFVLLVFCGWFSPAASQSDAKILFGLEIEARQAAVDVLENFYLLDRENTFIKYDRRGTQLAFYNNHRLGTPGHFDLSNPHKILLFYPEHQVIVFLDRNLTEVTRIDLNQLGMPDIISVAMANDNQIWVYDEFEQLLKKIDNDGTSRAVSENSHSIWGKALRPEKLIERYNRLLLFDPTHGLFLYDNLGNPMAHHSLSDFKFAEFINRRNLLLAHNDGRYFTFSLSSQDLQPLSLPDEIEKQHPTHISIKGNHIVVLSEKKMSVYRIR